ncbi:MAG: MFS transporter [Oscillospiraceae bacterium]|nr:MFS transporter [Oscillospiraceae bacterium]
MNFLKGYTKQEKSWMMYDWANSAESVIIVTILPIFYDTISANSTAAINRWGYGTSLSMLICALLAPLLGALGDFKGMRKKLFGRFMSVGIIACALLAFTPQMDVTTAAGSEKTGMIILALYIICSIGHAGANVYYDSFLTDVTTVDRMDKVSTMGYGMGYIGGSSIPLIIFLILNLIGLPMTTCLTIAFALTAVWWAVFSIPMFKNVHQVNGIEPYKGAVKDAVKGLGATAKEIFANKPMFIFLVAYFFYIDGVNTIIHMSTIYGSSLGIDSTQMMLALLLTQVLGLPFAMVYIKAAEKFGTRTMIGFGICMYMFICVFGFFLRSAWQFWMLAVLIATSQGGIQSMSRSMYGKLIPDKSRSGEFFGFYDIFGKFSAIMGPTLFGWSTAFAQNRIMAKMGIDHTAPAEVLDAVSSQASPWGVLSVLIIFIIGALLFFFLFPKAAKQAEN